MMTWVSLLVVALASAAPVIVFSSAPQSVAPGSLLAANEQLAPISSSVLSAALLASPAPRAVLVLAVRLPRHSAFPVLAASPVLARRHTSALPHSAVASSAALLSSLRAAGATLGSCSETTQFSVSGSPVVVVVAEATSAEEASAAVACVERASQGHFVGVLVAEEESDESGFVEDQEAVLRSMQERDESAPLPNGTYPVTPSYFPTYVWGWLIVVFVIILFVLFALSALSNVQVPPKLLSIDKAKKNK